ncbi:hypothetical protein JI721_15550 [Alicyclobacillus cycloheptanicus]|uniref:Stage III sporulation protein AG n=1 Tax=Alicyclobacillus cycloheptanicus TaxID=1457 RepID=A0ABT9XDK2_9BACL|nr:hypothetical protein [Alicyclobacillus cycloheptanicus]MDQ0188355.1 stage III sporulation protein AG [Alicyclobacillus cycloheptanicus]WDM03120.1 hypothetical protein JI721_15550 [Alicyclobacillus cycloheptanicus]
MDWKPFLQNRWLLVLGALGIVLLVFGSIWSRAGNAVQTVAGVAQQTQNSTTGSSNELSSDVNQVDPGLVFENLYDSQLTNMLDQIAGVNSVHVMVTLDSTETLRLAQNLQETTQEQGGTKTSTSVNKQTTTIHTASGADEPIVIERLAPAVRGVLVTVNAQDFYTAKAEIIDAITNVLDVPAYKISVEPQK